MISVIFKKEMRIFFRSSMTYVFFGLFTLLLGWIFFNHLSNFVSSVQKVPISMRNQYDFSNNVILKTFGNINFLLLFLAPLFSMRVFAEEFTNRTIYIYYTAGVTLYEILIGKYLALTFQGLLLLSTTLFFPFSLSNLNISDTSFIVTGFVGLGLNMTCFLGLGLLASSLSQNLFLSAFLAFIFVLFSWMMSLFSQVSDNYTVSEIFKYLSVNHHFENFAKANIALSDICFYITFITIILFLTKKVLELRREV